MDKLKPCPKCGDAWLYVSVGDWASGYECYGFRVNCKCGYAWKTLDAWFPNKEQAIKEWNRRQKVMYDNEELVKLLKTCAELRGECSLCIYQGNPCGCMPEALLENAAEVIEELNLAVPPKEEMSE